MKQAEQDSARIVNQNWAVVMEGVALFNNDQAFEAHEVWESLWLQLPRRSPQWYWYRGLIQVAAALVKFERGIPAGTQKLLTAALENFERGGCATFAREFAVGPLIETIEQQLKIVREGFGPTIQPEIKIRSV